MIHVRWNNQLADAPVWQGEISNRSGKEKIAQEVSRLVREGDVIGVGSGSTAYLALEQIADRVKEEGLTITGIPTSKEAEMNCAYFGIPTASLIQARPDWGFDGADEADDRKRLIKGRGGALLAEKLVMASSPKTYILVDDSKYVTELGAKLPVPIEVDPRAIHLVETKLEEFPIRSVTLRMAAGKDGPVITEAGNVLLDVEFITIEDDLEKALGAIPGVMETGLFIGYSVEFLTI
ncbi:ribose 5-phosphate isomerase A [Halobacillus sp. KGW1]|uniref:ribose 5-phosphate isomerase A n=1 Tax=Halobacillus sp. KGW1 TaxID=1793726 RepID=UPI001F19261A|nr:ribose 5-phosphate isomerase A [Halobacillus sp. KGW1]